MASHYDNPFDKADDINPFSNHHNVAPVHVPLDTAGMLRKKEIELQAKEADLCRREEIVRQKEAALAKAGVAVDQVKNWPSCYPIIHHDIAGDIPVYLQRLQYIAFATFLGVPASLLMNVIANIGAWITNATGGNLFFLSFIYLLLGPPGAYYLWYTSIYRALRTDKGVSFGLFFFTYLVHIVVFVFAAVGPPIIFRGLYFAGLLTAIEVLPNHPVIGILYFIAFGLFTTEAIVSIWFYQQVFRYFRGSGKFAESRRGAAAASLSHAI